MLIRTILLLLCAVSLSIEKGPRKRNCNAVKDRYYDPNRGKCRRCKRCDEGEGRNYSELITLKIGDYGDEECYPCRPCPDGSFNDRSYPQCKSCETNCKARHREVRVACNARADNQCGACLPGYYDTESDVNLPCKPLQTIANAQAGVSASIHDQPQTPPTEAVVTQKEMNNVSDATVVFQNGEKLIEKHEEAQTPRVGTSQGQRQSEDNSASIAIMAIACSIGATLVIVAVLIVVKWRCQRKRGHSVSQTCGDESNVQIRFTDIQMEEMESDEGIGTPASAGQSASTSMSSITNSKEYADVEETCGSSDEGICKDKEKRRRSRQCVKNVTKEDDLSTDAVPLLPRRDIVFRSKPMQKSHVVFLFVSCYVTDEGEALFEALGVPLHEVKQLQKEREKDKFLWKEYVLRVLNRWVEIKAKEATLLKLENCLRNNGYDNITEEMRVEFDIKDTPTEDS